LLRSLCKRNGQTVVNRIKFIRLRAFGASSMRQSSAMNNNINVRKIRISQIMPRKRDDLMSLALLLQNNAATEKSTGSGDSYLHALS